MVLNIPVVRSADVQLVPEGDSSDLGDSGDLVKEIGNDLGEGISSLH